MNKLPDIKFEIRFSIREFKARYHMIASDAESMTLRDLLAMAALEEYLQRERSRYR